MPLKFRLKGLAETFVENACCPKCLHDGADEGEQGFYTELTKVTYDGIVVVIQCPKCAHVFMPDGQRNGVINHARLRAAVERDSSTTGQPILQNREAVKNEVEKINAQRNDKVQ